MSTRDTATARAIRTASEDLRRVTAELGRAQRSTGLSDDAIGRACHMSRFIVARTLSGTRVPSNVELAAIGAAVGIDVRLQAYLAGAPIRDAGQQRLLDRLRAELPASISVTYEVPLPVAGDLRAWDAMLRGATWRRPVEAETIIDDVQAVERRLRLKMRDGGEDAVILLVADTGRNRRALASAPAAFAGFDRTASGVLRALRAGRDPGGSSIVLL
ncbi:MAG TPA: hypothetical protein VFJ71_05765 [Candidatus Limnocylindrales bacterium]|nr:hypothetical protein [Candidatus Limnocylindrales bacterium]